MAMVRKNRENNEEDLDFEVQFYENILKRKPDFVQALVALGDLYTKKGLHKEGLAIDQRLEKLRPYNPLVLYNLACSYSLIKDCAKALEAIQKAVACGYHDFEYLAQDPDLENLRSDICFQQYFAEVKNKYLTNDKR